MSMIQNDTLSLKRYTGNSLLIKPRIQRVFEGTMSWVVGLANNSYKPITNTVWVRARFCKLQKRCTRLTDASDKVYQLLVHGRWFSPASSTTKTGRHDIAEILLKVALSTIKIKSNQRVFVPKGSSKLHPLHNCSSKFRLTVYVEILQSLLVVLSFFYLRLLITPFGIFKRFLNILVAIRTDLSLK